MSGYLPIEGVGAELSVDPLREKLSQDMQIIVSILRSASVQPLNICGSKSISALPWCEKSGGCGRRESVALFRFCKQVGRKHHCPQSMSIWEVLGPGISE